jgi:hypothetical protein
LASSLSAQGVQLGIRGLVRGSACLLATTRRSHDTSHGCSRHFAATRLRHHGKNRFVTAFLVTTALRAGRHEAARLAFVWRKTQWPLATDAAAAAGEGCACTGCDTQRHSSRHTRFRLGPRVVPSSLAKFHSHPPVAATPLGRGTMNPLVRSTKLIMCFVAGGALSTLYHQYGEQAQGTLRAPTTPPVSSHSSLLPASNARGAHTGGDASSFASDVISAANARVEAANVELSALKSAHAKLELTLKQARSTCTQAVTAQQRQQVSVEHPPASTCLLQTLLVSIWRQFSGH